MPNQHGVWPNLPLFQPRTQSIAQTGELNDSAMTDTLGKQFDATIFNCYVSHMM